LDDIGKSREQVLAELTEAYNRDQHFKDGRILGSMCTIPHELAREAHMKFIETNLGNPGLYRGTKQLEKKVIEILSDMVHAKNKIGHMTNGGTESNITALWIAKKLSGSREILYPKNSHFSIIKAIDILDLTGVPIDLDETYCMALNDIDSKLSDNTAAVVCMAGATELGTIDHIEQISKLCTDRTNNVFVHVDAAFGGMVIPFLKELGYEMPKFDFEVDGVSSLTIDPHKMGFSTIPAGALLYRHNEYMDSITVDAPYLIDLKYSTFSGTRNSAAVAATYAVLSHMGRKGFRAVVAECMENTKFIAKRAVELGFELVMEPMVNIVAIKLKQTDAVVSELKKQDWYVSKGRFPPCLRIVVMPHVTRKVINEFLPVLEKTCRALGEL
jgi:tyrosine decarboxylase/aspartate 1-decarboxylase